MPEGSDRRQREHPRYEVNAYVDYTGSEVLLYHKIQNISLGGICIQSASIEEVGTIVDIVINFPDLDVQVALRGEVVWANREPPMDMGIRYIDLDEDRKETLRKYIGMVKKK
jgi:PilZ domain